MRGPSEFVESLIYPIGSILEIEGKSSLRCVSDAIFSPASSFEI